MRLEWTKWINSFHLGNFVVSMVQHIFGLVKNDLWGLLNAFAFLLLLLLFLLMIFFREWPCSCTSCLNWFPLYCWQNNAFPREICHYWGLIPRKQKESQSKLKAKRNCRHTWEKKRNSRWKKDDDIKMLFPSIVHSRCDHWSWEAMTLLQYHVPWSCSRTHKLDSSNGCCRISSIFPP